MDRSDSWILSGVLIIGVATYFTWTLSSAYFDATAAATYPTTTGTVLRSEVTAPFSGGAWAHDLEYRFEVDGKTYTGTRIRTLDAKFGSQRSNRAAKAAARKRAEAQRDEYPVGREVTVYYDPGAPGTCVLDPAVPRNLQRGLGLSLFVFTAGGVFFLVGIFLRGRSAA